jgi:hypothetical protein
MNLKNIPSSILFYFIGKYTSKGFRHDILVLRADGEANEIDRNLNKKYGLPGRYSKIDPIRI